MVPRQKRAGGRTLPLSSHESVKMEGLPPTEACHFHHMQKSQHLASQPVSLVGLKLWESQSNEGAGVAIGGTREDKSVGSYV